MGNTMFDIEASRNILIHVLLDEYHILFTLLSPILLHLLLGYWST